MFQLLLIHNYVAPIVMGYNNTQDLTSDGSLGVTTHGKVTLQPSNVGLIQVPKL